MNNKEIPIFYSGPKDDSLQGYKDFIKSMMHHLHGGRIDSDDMTDQRMGIGLEIIFKQEKELEAKNKK